MDTGLDENKAELAVLVLAVALKVLADSDSLLDQGLRGRVSKIYTYYGFGGFLRRDPQEEREQGLQFHHSVST